MALEFNGQNNYIFYDRTDIKNIKNRFLKINLLNLILFMKLNYI